MDPKLSQSPEKADGIRNSNKKFREFSDQVSLQSESKVQSTRRRC